MVTAAMLTALAPLSAVRSHHYAAGGPDDRGAWAEHVAHAARSARRTGRPELIHAHRHGAACNERCALILPPA